MGTAERRKEARTVIASSYLGSTIEYYDFLLYATAAAVVFPKVFFSGMDDWVGVVAAYGTFAAGYVAARSAASSSATSVTGWAARECSSSPCWSWAWPPP